MEIFEKSHLEQWAQKIHAGLSPILSIQSDLERIASVLGCIGMQSSIDSAFEDIQEGAYCLEGQLALIKDQLKELKEEGTEIARLRTGEYTMVGTEDSDDKKGK
jgi:hypothetical protein